MAAKPSWGPPINTAEHGQYVLTLKPSADTPTLGRDGFTAVRRLQRIARLRLGWLRHHAQIVREQVWKSGDRDLEVVAEIPTQDPVEGQANR